MQKNRGKHTNQTVSPFRLASFPPMVRLQIVLCDYAVVCSQRLCRVKKKAKILFVITNILFIFCPKCGIMHYKCYFKAVFSPDTIIIPQAFVKVVPTKFL